MKQAKLSLNKLEQNTGQIPGLPANPREWTQTDIDRLAASLLETPELFDARPIVVFPLGDKYIILAGNLRYSASKKNKAKTVPCIIVPEDMPVSKLGQIVLKDNGVFGQWDYAQLLEDWDDIDLEDLGISVPAPADYSGKNTELNPDDLKETITLRLRYHEPDATLVKLALGDNPKDTLLTALRYAD